MAARRGPEQRIRISVYVGAFMAVVLGGLVVFISLSVENIHSFSNMTVFEILHNIIGVIAAPILVIVGASIGLYLGIRKKSD
jgi:hypothetical protein